MTAHFGAATDGLTIGRGALRQLHESLLRDAADHAVNILQEAGFAAGAGVYQAFRTWLPGETAAPEPQDLKPARLNAALWPSSQPSGWGSSRWGPSGRACRPLA